MATVLLTGFEPFADEPVNPSGDVLPLVAQDWDRPERLVTAVLPVEYAGSRTALEALLAEHRPDVVVALGLALGRDAVTPETTAVNEQSARIPDNAGDQPQGEPVVPGAAATEPSSLPLAAVHAALRAAGVPEAPSHDAGRFVCNHVFFLLQHAHGRLDDPSAARTGFVHVPSYDVVSRPELARAVRVVLDAALDTEERGGPAAAAPGTPDPQPSARHLPAPGADAAPPLP
ncbi:pyroglutamyl-peptidase I [Nocardioides sp. ChNu-153]|uniref:pyroglutamyl-peptidase I n=1 Tax=unclassified Nocardioides TaxID=2615069 RepID=UPI0024067748|nr:MULTISPECIES: pyroglutamyl-peptidase I [unclassified Nocardioides]MDF9716651.1 pyroglutamyl-peptidase I [Nocardioides sp. ChNu-99]MDN7123060.1 pyroglutamyl-peptidase I [Nocardioides sp. ChNu-153]